MSIPPSPVIVVLTALLAASCTRESAPETGDQVLAPSPAAIISAPDEIAARELLTWTEPVLEFADDEAATVLAQAGQALADGRLYQEMDAAIPLYLALRRHSGYQSAANTGLLRAARALLTQGNAALQQDGDGALQQAQQTAAVLRALWPTLDEINAAAVLAEVAAFLQRLALSEQVWALNSEGERALQAGHLGEAGGGALTKFRAAQALAPGQPRAREGIAAVETALIERAEHAVLADDFAAAATWLEHAGTVREDPSAVLEAAARIERLRSTRISRLRAQAASGLGRYGGIQKAQANLQQIEAIADPGDFVAADLRARIETARHYGLFGPGQMVMEALQDGGRGPQMAVLAHGEFQMGAMAADEDAHANESPAHPVRFERGFAISVHEITVAEFGRFVRASGYQSRAARRGFSMAYDERSGNFVRRSGVDWQSDYAGNPADANLPVVHVSAIDAAAYAAWLSAQTGAVYRLPSEAEFEYALRAGSASLYPWPDDAPPPPGAGNLTGSEDQSPGGRTWANAFVGYGDGYWGPAPVGRFAENGFGVHDLAGNVSEWVADCWHASYRRAPGDGSAWVNPGCRDQVIRGGSWASSPAQTRASWRAPASVDTTNARIGFRVVRVL